MGRSGLVHAGAVGFSCAVVQLRQRRSVQSENMNKLDLWAEDEGNSCKIDVTGGTKLFWLATIPGAGGLPLEDTQAFRARVMISYEEILRSTRPVGLSKPLKALDQVNYG